MPSSLSAHPQTRPVSTSSSSSSSSGTHEDKQHTSATDTIWTEDRCATSAGDNSHNAAKSATHRLASRRSCVRALQLACDLCLLVLTNPVSHLQAASTSKAKQMRSPLHACPMRRCDIFSYIKELTVWLLLNSLPAIQSPAVSGSSSSCWAAVPSKPSALPLSPADT